jgi:hypothetical protein
LKGGDTNMQDAAMPLNRRGQRHRESHHGREPIPAATRTRPAPCPAPRPPLQPAIANIHPSPPQSPAGIPSTSRGPKLGRVSSPAGSQVRAKIPSPAGVPNAASVTARHSNPAPAATVADRIDRHRQPTPAAAAHPGSDHRHSVADARTATQIQPSRKHQTPT